MKWAFAVAALGWAGCAARGLGSDTIAHDGSVSGDSGAQRGADGGGPADLASTVAGCGQLQVGSSRVLIDFKSGPPPDNGFGGAIVDGTYDILSSTIYQSTPTTDQYWVQSTIRISGGGTRLEVAVAGGTDLTETLAPSGNALNYMVVCPPNASGIGFGPNYTATGDTFAEVNGLYVQVFKLR